MAGDGLPFPDERCAGHSASRRLPRYLLAVLTMIASLKLILD
jgi:hypothetical protein